MPCTAYLSCRRGGPAKWPLALSGLVFLALSGCISSGPAAVRPPSIDAWGSAKQAMKLYDTNGDGFLDGPELEKVPGVKAAMKTVDTNGDGKVTAEEIAARIESWQYSEIGVAALICDVRLDGRPLSGATVTFEPESFLGENIQVAESETDTYGNAYPSVPEDKRPTADTPAGLALGFYRVKISKMVNGKETIPAKYNTDTELGLQVAADEPTMMSRQPLFDMKSK